MANEFNVAVKLHADASQYTAEFTKAGQTAQAFSAQIAGSSSATSSAVQAAVSKVESLGTAASAATDKVNSSLNASVPSAKAMGNTLAGVGDAAAKAGNAASNAFEKSTISAKQHAAALRGVPAQITDIVVGLQGGQAPMTVMLQQGGQLKDMFGGTVPAVRALSGAVLGMVNPFTLVTAAAGVALLAYQQGSAEADGYRAAILMSGNAAGTTVGQLSDMARAVSEVTGTQGAAAAALTEMAGSGAVARENLQRFTEVAMGLEKYVGVPVKATVKDLEQLGQAPLQASIKLNEQYHYLTASVYEHIKALEEQGRKEEAGAAAQKAYVDAFEARKNAMAANLGTIERAWMGVTAAAKNGWDAILNIGREETKGEQLETLRKKIAEREKQLAQMADDGFGSTAGGAATGRASQAKTRLQAELAGLGAQAAALEGVAYASQVAAEAEAKRAKQTELLIRWDKEGDQFKQRAAKRDEEIRKAEIEGRALINNGLLTEKELRDRIADIQKKYKDSKVGGGISASDSHAAALKGQLGAAQQYFEQLKQYGAQAEQLNAGERESLRIAEQLKLATDAKTIAKLKDQQVTADALAVQLRTNEGLKNSLAAHDKLIDVTAQDARGIDQRAAQQEAANQVFGKGRTAIEAMTLATLQHQMAEAQASDRFDPKYIASLQLKINAQNRFVDALGAADYKAVTAHADALLRTAQELSLVYADELRLSGMSALEREKIVVQRQVELKYAKELADIDKSSLTDEQKATVRRRVEHARRIEGEAAVAKVVQSDWAKTSDEINRSLTDALLRGAEAGKGYFRNLRDTAVNMFSSLVLRPVISAVMTPASMAASSAVNSGMSALGLAGNASSLYSLSSSLGAVTAGLGSFGTAITAGIQSMVGVTGTSAQMVASLQAAGYWTGSATATAASTAGASAGAAAATAIPYVAVAAVVANALGLFRKTEQRGAGVVGTLGEGDLHDYALMRKGGTLFSGPSYSVRDSGVSSQSQALQDAYSAMREATAGMAGQLGLGSDAIKTFTTRLGDDLIHPDTGGYGIKLDGLDDAQATAKVQAALGNANEALAKFALGTEDYTRKGETAVQTMGRLSSSITGVNSVFDAMGAQLYEASLAGADMASSLIDVFGGADSFAARTSSYYQEYYSEGERAANLTRVLTNSFSELGLALPASRDQLRQYVEAQDLTTEEGRKSYAALLQLSGAFASITDSADAAAKELEASASRIADVFGKLYDSIARERENVASSSESIRDFGVMTRDQIAAGIASAMVNAPNAASVIETQGAVAPAYAGLDAAKNGQNHWGGVDRAASANLATTQKAIADLDGWFAGVQKSFEAFAAYRDWAWSGAGSYSESMALVPENQRRTAQYASDLAAYNAQRKVLDAQRAQQQAAQAAARAEASAFAQQVEAWKAAVSAAEGAAGTAQSEYSTALRDYVVDAGKAVGKLGKLREETMRWYESQQQLASAMLGSAAQLRDAAQVMRYGQLDEAQTLEQRRREFEQSYSLALATTGTTQAGYADKMAAALPALSDSIANAAASRAEWAVATAKMYQQSQSVAAALEAAAPRDYQGEALGLLTTIDGTLGAIEAASASAEKVISDAVYATGADNLTGLRAVVAALRGETVPAFAAGGMHVGGLRLVGEHGPELEATGPSRIWNAAQTRSMLGGGDSGLALEIRALRAQVAELTARVVETRDAARSTTVNTSRSDRKLDQIVVNGLEVRTDASAPLQMVIA